MYTKGIRVNTKFIGHEGSTTIECNVFELTYQRNIAVTRYIKSHHKNHRL